MRLVIATGNPGKLAEMRQLLRPLGYTAVAQTELGVGGVAEPGPGFIENALIKARHASRFTGLPAIADDSGLVVAALDGAPGVYSARYAGAGADAVANNRKLLAALRDVPPDQRCAYFFCQAVAVRSADDPRPLLAEGVWRGRILELEAGDGGFGYDPLFQPDGESRSAAELPAETKNRVSHRGQALAVLRRLIEAYW